MSNLVGIETVCILGIESRYYKFELGKKYKCRVYNNKQLNELVFIFQINGYGFKKEAFDKYFLTLNEYRNKKLEQLL